MVVIILGTLQFEAEKFESRTMPTPNMKGKEVIYWIKVVTKDKRLATDLQRFLEGAAHFIDLRVPSAFVSAKTELESFKMIPSNPIAGESISGKIMKEKSKKSGGEESRGETEFEDIRLEIVLRRTHPETPAKLTQSPYG